MTEVALAKIREILTNSHFLQALKKEFDYSFEISIAEVEGKVRMQFMQKDSGLEYMTLSDVSALLQMDRRAIRQMTEARAQTTTPNPLPFIRIGKNLRFKRSDIIRWIEAKGAESAVLPPVKGKVPRKKYI
jgi:predicted DNA-binding transcriptional regulator AlpA